MQQYKVKYPHLFSPLVVGTKVFRNRVIAAPTHHNFAAATDDRLNQCGVETYGARALGGAAAVTIGEGKLDQLNSTGHTGHIDCCTPESITPLQWYADYVHDCGALASIEFNHAGQFAQPIFNPGRIGPMGASACTMQNGLFSREMTVEDMELVADNYAQASLTAKKAGLDMVNLHLGHGWLLGGFLSPSFNHRTDAYGGTLENRVRFPRMVLERVRAAIGNDMLIEIRLSGDEMIPNGLHIEDTIQIVHILEDLVDMVQLSCGTRLDPIARCMIGPDNFTDPGHNAPLTEQLKKSGTKVPVGVVGNITTPALAEQILANGQADYIVMARSLIADPDWVRKTKEAREDEIRPCIKCSRCGDMQKSICSVNPTFGHHAMRTQFPIPEKSKRVAVIGGGVAGMQAALACVERGHSCVLFEKSGRLGGQLSYTDHVWFKREMREYRDYLIRQVNAANIDIRLNTNVTAAQIESMDFDSAIVAVGAEPLIPRIPGADGKNVTPALYVFGNESLLPDRVVIIGGGLVGCELSLQLSSYGICSTVVEMGPDLAPDCAMNERNHLLHLLKLDANISTLTQHRCMEINEAGAIVEDSCENRIEIPGKHVILACGMRSLSELRNSFSDCALNVISVGDCKKVGNIYTAVSSGYGAALTI